MEEKLRELEAQIKQWAGENDNVVQYSMIVDILKEECENIGEEYLSQIVYELSAEGIRVEPFERDETYSADEEEPEKFIPADVNITQKPMNIYNLMERLEYGEIDLQPDFQRKGGLWSNEQQSQLIESLMLKIPLPAFYFNASVDDRWVVIDGLQRLTAFNNFWSAKRKKDLKNCSICQNLTV